MQQNQRYHLFLFFLLPCQNLVPTINATRLPAALCWKRLMHPAAGSLKQRWGVGYRGLVSLFLSNSPPSDFFIFKPVVFNPNQRWLKWHHLRQISRLHTCNFFFIQSVVLPEISKQTLMCEIDGVPTLRGGFKLWQDKKIIIDFPLERFGEEEAKVVNIWWGKMRSHCVNLL